MGIFTQILPALERFYCNNISYGTYYEQHFTYSLIQFSFSIIHTDILYF